MNQILHGSHVSRMISENRTQNLICVQEILQDLKKKHCLHKYFLLQPSPLYAFLQMLKFYTCIMYINCENYR